MEPSPLFLNDDELHQLTGRKVRRLQVEQLRRMMIPFHINALGRPVVARAVILGLQIAAQDIKKAWAPRVVNG